MAHNILFLTDKILFKCQQALQQKHEVYKYILHTYTDEISFEAQIR